MDVCACAYFVRVGLWIESSPHGETGRDCGDDIPSGYQGVNGREGPQCRQDKLELARATFGVKVLN